MVSRDPPGPTSPRWDAAAYLRRTDERQRPFWELLDRVGADQPSLVVDLGCGPGPLTAGLARRWPSARVIGVDSSPEMVQAASAYAGASLSFEVGDVESWTPPGEVDVLVANAVLHWVPGHLALFDRFVGWLRTDGWFAFQVPGNFEAPSHVLLAELRNSPRWRDRLGADAVRSGSVLEPAEYAQRLTRLGCRVDAWETTYLHVLEGEDPVLRWTEGTALRPVITALGDDPDAKQEFLAEYAELLRQAYPRTEHGTVFPFRRIFVVAHRRGRGRRAASAARRAVLGTAGRSS
jgi:trans-aconitate 2-methyltransferase